MMQNWFAIESEAEHRRQESVRASAADAKAALARVERVKPRWMRPLKVSLSGLTLKRLAIPGLSLATAIASRRGGAWKTQSSV